ncbi:MAG TPA: hypothetical protein VL728_01915 [Cyclobacteriaceae bacterium]|jgi:hypothetical protein|nr:hypothetical protein [Cyclobacteriaceae bacterium]
MKKITVALVSLLMVSCASIPPVVGNWDYKITGTPQGDYAGVLVVSQGDKKTLNAVMKSNGTDLPFNQFQFDKKTNKSFGNFYYQGMSISFNATVAPTTMDGSISVENTNFPFNATRKK